MTGIPTLKTKKESLELLRESSKIFRRIAQEACESLSQLPMQEISGGDPVDAGEFPSMVHFRMRYPDWFFSFIFKKVGLRLRDYFVSTKMPSFSPYIS